MPPRAKTSEEVVFEQNTILDAALELIGEFGYKRLSIRMIAEKCKTSATKLYYYFLNKEEIYFGIMSREYQKLLEKIMEISEEEPDPTEQLKKVVRAICAYGRANESCYDLLFNSLTPRCTDYPSPTPVVMEEKRRAFAFYDAWRERVYAFGADTGKEITEYDCVLKFSQVHGLISLYNSRNLTEIEIDYEEALEQLLVQIVQ